MFEVERVVQILEFGWLELLKLKEKKNLIVDGQLPKARASKIQNSFPEYNKI